MALVAGIDSSTQSCKVVIRDAETGALLREGRAAHPDGTEVDPANWWTALETALAEAGGIADVVAIAVGAQQHGMVCLDSDGEVVRPALLWNDTRSSMAAGELVDELGGPRAWAQAVGSVPVASFTVTKLRWLAEHEPQNAARTAAVCLPHDWLTWQLAGAPDLAALTTDRGDASGTGYWSPASGAYRPDLLRLALGQDALLPRVLAPAEAAGSIAPAVAPGEVLIGPGTGDNAAAALGVGARAGDVVVSIGTSGVVAAVADVPAADPTGIVWIRRCHRALPATGLHAECGPSPGRRGPHPRCGPCRLFGTGVVRTSGSGRDDGGALLRGRAHPRPARRDRRRPRTTTGQCDPRQLRPGDG